MANQNKMIKAFDPNKSIRANRLMGLTDKEIFNRYFIKDNGVEWLDDFNALKNMTDTNGKDVYRKTVSLLGQPLRLICTILQKRLLEEYTPVGYKFNAKSFIEDLEALLNDNPNQSRETAVSQKANEFTIQLSNFLVETVNRGITYQSGFSVD